MITLLTDQDNQRAATYRTAQAWAAISGAPGPNPEDTIWAIQKKIANAIITWSNNGGGSSPGSGVTSVSASSLSPLFSVSVATPTTTPAISFSASSVAPNLVLAGPAGGSTAAPWTFRALVPGDLPSLSGVYQPINPNLTAISNLSNANGFLKNNGSGVFTYATVSVAAPLTGNGVTTSVSIPMATAVANGYLSSTDWSTFNSKLSSVTSDAPLTGAGTSASHLSIPAASASVNGYLSSADWATFNSKVSSGAITTSGLTMASARLLGRTTAGIGAIEELTTGTSLSLSAGSLNTIQGIRTSDSPQFTSLGLGAAAVTSTIIRMFGTASSNSQPRGILVSSTLQSLADNTTAEAIYVSPTIDINGFNSVRAVGVFIGSSSTGSGSYDRFIGLEVAGGSTAANRFGIVVDDLAGPSQFNDTTDASSFSTGSLQTAGGLGVAKKIITNSSIQTGTPGGSGAGAWKLGTEISGAFAADLTKAVEIDIGGTLIRLAVLV